MMRPALQMVIEIFDPKSHELKCAIVFHTGADDYRPPLWALGAQRCA
jgi:hypothetical protein